MKKALVFDPYLDTLGGGERYVLTFALGLIENGYSVDLAWPTRKELTEASQRFGLDFTQIHISPDIYQVFTSKSSLAERFNVTREYDLVFWVSDGSVPLLFSKNNLIHFQVPFKNLGGNYLTNSIKSLSVHKFIYNSQFTRNVIEKQLIPSKGYVLYPPIDTGNFLPGKKTDTILSVARFDPSLTSKHQDILIEAFKNFSVQNPSYKLILAGGLKGDMAPVNELKKMADGFNVEILVAPDFKKLKSLYSEARFFWHAAGFGVDEEKNPENVEHFGMTTVESMAAGCIPVVINKGGQKEIITEDTGFLCESPEEMTTITDDLVHKEFSLKKISKLAQVRSEYFSVSKFYDRIKEIIAR